MPSRKTEANAYRESYGDNIAGIAAAEKTEPGTIGRTRGVSPRYIQSIEAGDYVPSLQNLVRLRGAVKSSGKSIRWLQHDLASA